jgi:chorismate mutase
MHMASVSDLRRQVDGLDRQMVDLLARRTTIVRQVMQHLGEEDIDKEREAQVLSNWLEEGIDLNLDESALEKVCKSVMEMGRRSKES